MSNVKQFITGDDVRKYIQSGGKRCPFCGSEEIDGSSWTADGNWATHESRCTGCGASWEDLYTLTDIVNIEKPSEGDGE